MKFHELAMKFSSLSCAKHTFKTYILNHILRAVLFNVRIEITRARKVKFERTSERSLRFATLPSLFIPPSLMVLAFQSLINKETSIQQWYIDILRFVSYVVTHRPAYHQYDNSLSFPQVGNVQKHLWPICIICRPGHVSNICLKITKYLWIKVDIWLKIYYWRKTQHYLLRYYIDLYFTNGKLRRQICACQTEQKKKFPWLVSLRVL